MNRRTLLKTATGLATAASLTGLFARTPDGSFGSIDRALQNAVAAKTVAGVVAMAATDRGIVYEGAFGKRRIPDGPAMTADTVFWLLSMTKAVTATACMQLVERGKLRLEQPMAEVLPALAALRCWKASTLPESRYFGRRSGRSHCATC